MHPNITAGGDRLEFQGNTSTETAGLETAKMVFNSVVSTLDEKFMTIDISTITRISIYEIQHFNMIPQEVIDHYGLQNKAINDGSTVRLGGCTTDLSFL